jgi:dTDP-4-dehydrorhamnose reductase
MARPRADGAALKSAEHAVKVLLTGAGGQVGRAFRALPSQEGALAALSHAELDITDAAQVKRAVQAHAPEWIVNAAGYTAVDAAESAREAAHNLNATAVAHLAAAARDCGARLVHISTDFVFDGQASRPYAPDAATAPLGAYGATKLAGERAALAGNSSSIIVRTSWVYAAQGQNFVRTMLRLMGSKPGIRVVCDQVGSPTWATSLARLLWRMIEIDAPAGIYHWSDAGVASWYDFAVAIQEEALQRGLLGQATAVLPIETREYPTPARRPHYSVLDTARTRALTGVAAVHWRVQLRNMLDELAASG